MKKPAIQPRKASFSVLVVAVTLFVSSAFAKDGLQIDKAYCGATGSWRDVTAFLQHQLKGDTLSVDIAQPFEEFGGDPAFGRVKNLIIDYRLNGKHSRLLLFLFILCIFSFFSLFFPLSYFIFILFYCLCFRSVFFSCSNTLLLYILFFLKKKVKEVLVCWQQNIDAYFDGMSLLKGYVVMLKNQNAS